MSVASRTTLKGYFETGDRPTEAQFIDLIDSFLALDSGETDTVTGAHTFSGAQVFSGGVTINNTGLQVDDTGGDHQLSIVPNEDLTADRTLNIIVGNATRTITLNGNTTLGDWFDQSVKQAATPTFGAVTLNGDSQVTGVWTVIGGIANGIISFQPNDQSQDWRMQVIQSNGNWSLLDNTGSATPLVVENAAPTNALYVSTSGIHVGGASPGAQVDIKSGTAGRVGLIVSSAASPTASIVQFQVNGTTRARVTKDAVIDAGYGLALGSSSQGTVPVEVTISAGAITIAGSYHRVDTESDAATDDLDTINGGINGQILVLQSVSGGRDTTIKHGTGNIYLDGGADFTLSIARDKIMLIYREDLDEWYEISRSSNN